MSNVLSKNQRRKKSRIRRVGNHRRKMPIKKPCLKIKRQRSFPRSARVTIRRLSQQITPRILVNSPSPTSSPTLGNPLVPSEMSARRSETKVIGPRGSTFNVTPANSQDGLNNEHRTGVHNDGFNNTSIDREDTNPGTLSYISNDYDTDYLNGLNENE